jgi:Peptidase family M28/PA domain
MNPRADAAKLSRQFCESTMLVQRFFLLLFLAGVSVPAATATDPAARVRSSGVRAHVSFLADDLLEGRAPGTRGFDIAASYVTAQFRQYGLLPLAPNRSFYQTVPLLEATAVLPGSSAVLQRDDARTEFEYGTDFLPSADFANANTTLTAPLAFVGFGIEAPELDYDDFAHVDVKGRIAVLFNGTPAKFTADQRAYYSWTVTKFSTLIRHGAVGAIVVDTSDDEQRLPWETRLAESWMPQMRWLATDNQPAEIFPELRLRFRFNRQAAARLFENGPQSFDQASTKAAAGEPQGFDLPGSITLTATTGLRRTESDNVIGIWEGADPQLRSEYILISAHLDHLGRGKSINGDAIYNGAHDNAVGVGIMLEIARALSNSGVRARRSIIFAALTGEEKGLLGSDYFANHPPVPINRIVASLNLDMPLVLAKTRDLVAIGAEHTTLGPLAAETIRRYGYRLSKEGTPDSGAFVRSDQFSFIRQGIPSILIESGNQARDPKIDVVAMKREFLDKRYRQPSDDLLSPIDYDAAADIARINLSMAVDIGDSDERPQWNRGDFFGNQFAVQKKAPPPRVAPSGTQGR